MWRDQLLNSVCRERLVLCVVRESYGMLEATGRGDMVHNAIGMAEVTDFRNSIAFRQHERPDGALGQQRFTQRKSRMSARLQDQGSESMFGQNASQSRTVKAAADNAHIKWGARIGFHEEIKV